MRIEHVAIWTTKLEELKAFYTENFGAVPSGKYCNPAKKFESYFLAFAAGARLEIMRTSSLSDSVQPEAPRCGFAHIAFSAGSRAKVDELTEQLRQKGCRVVSEPRMTGDGYYESCILDPDGNRVELTE